MVLHVELQRGVKLRPSIDLQMRRTHRVKQACVGVDEEVCRKTGNLPCPKILLLDALRPIGRIVLVDGIDVRILFVRG